MKPTLLCLSLALVVSHAFGQMPPPLLPVDDITKLADPKNRTIEKSPLQKNLIPEKTPSGMTVYRESPAKPMPGTEVAVPPAKRAAPAITPEEAKQFREAEQRAIERNKLAEDEVRCKGLGPFARLVAEARQRGVPLAAAETLLTPKNLTQQAESFSKDIIRVVYKNNLTTENAEEIIIGSCQIMVSTAAKMREVESQTTAAKAEQPKTTSISESTFGTDWPFTVPSGVLGCKSLGDLHLVTFTANGVTYAVNGTARSRLKQFGFRDSDEIWKRNPKYPKMRVTSTIVERGLALCR